MSIIQYSDWANGIEMMQWSSDEETTLAFLDFCRHRKLAYAPLAAPNYIVYAARSAIASRSTPHTFLMMAFAFTFFSEESKFERPMQARRGEECQHLCRASWLLGRVEAPVQWTGSYPATCADIARAVLR